MAKALFINFFKQTRAECVMDSDCRIYNRTGDFIVVSSCTQHTLCVLRVLYV